MLKTYTVHVQTTGLMALFHRLLEMTITVIVVVLTLHHQHKHSDVLWEGKGCLSTIFCCSNSGMPWFCKTLTEPTVDYIEVRNCHNKPSYDEDTAISLIELYIHQNDILNRLLHASITGIHQ